METDAGLDLGLLHLVGIGEREGARQVNALALDGDFTLGNGSVTLDFAKHIAYLYLLVAAFFHLGLNVADGQFAA